MASEQAAARLTEHEALERYGSVVCRFTEYHKYVFTFEGDAPDGAHVTILRGGASGDIYRVTVTPNTTATLVVADSAFIVKDGVTVYHKDFW